MLSEKKAVQPACEWSGNSLVISVLKCTLCVKDSSFQRRVSSDPHVLKFPTSVAMITPVG